MARWQTVCFPSDASEQNWKIYIKVKKKHFIFIIQNNNKKLKHEPSLKKPGDFTVAEGHGHPLVEVEGSK